MHRPTLKVSKQSGVSLIEALIALAIFSVGILAIANFQGMLVSESAYSKTRNEAVQLAQEKLDEIRNYPTEQQLVANLINATVDPDFDFPDDVTSGTYPVTPEPIAGTATDFTRQWQVTCTGDVCTVVALVRWSDPKEGPQLVSLDTDVTFKDPRSSANLDTNVFTPLVPSATGRAYLGDGTVDADQLAAGTDNQDGTISIADVGDDRVLVDSSNPTTDDDGNTVYNIVLTLEDACLTEDGTCIDFVKIKGRIYRDVTANPGAALSDIYVVASDAAYCARNFNPDGDDHSVENPPTTATGDYQYYDYTCYLGGGWHGNIGLIISDAGSQDTACLGDPSSPNYDDNDGDNNWRQMELAKRRVYRGMTFIGDASTGVLPAGTLYYSQGIADATELPDPGDKDENGDLIPNTAFRYYGHDYVLTRITGQPTGSDCHNSLTRGDTDTNGDGTMGDLFYGVATDFVCLNEERVSGTFKYLDTFRTGHWAKDFCPYDPSRGPALGYYITGRVSVPTGDVLDGTEIANSVSADNCTFVTSLSDMNNLTPLDVTGQQFADYVCLVYDWGNGWTGSVYVDEGFGITCPEPIAFTAISGDSGDIFSGNDFICETLAQPDIGGTITAYMNDLTGTTVTAVRENTDGTMETHTCNDVTFSGDHNEYAEFGCTVAEETLGGGWIGTVTVTTPDGIVCNTTTGTGTNWDSNSPLSKAWDATSPLTAANIDLSTKCYGPIDELTITGYINSDLSMEGLALPSVTATNVTAAGCTVELLSATQARYTCPVTFDYATGWDGSVAIDTSTSPALSCSPLSHTTGLVTDDTTVATTTNCLVDQNGKVYFEGRVYDLVTPTLPGDIWIDYRDVNGDGTYLNFGVLRDDSGAIAGSCTFYWAYGVYNDGDDNNYAYRCTSTATLSPGQKWNGTMEVFALAPNITCNPVVTYSNLRPNTTNVQDFAVAPDSATCTANGL